MRRITPPRRTSAHSLASFGRSRRASSATATSATTASTGPSPGIAGSDGPCGTSPSAHTDATSAVATSVSKISTTDIEEAIVATLVPCMRVRSRTTLAASPPRAGVAALSATPAA